jgi:hypothetical protein
MRYPLLAIFLLAACSADDHAGNEPAPPEVADGCNPLIGDDCLTPFPSTVHQVADPSTRTGYRVSVAKIALPVQTRNVPLDAARLNKRDGFSPAMPFIVYFQAGVDVTQLPTLDRLADSVAPTSAVQLIAYDDGTRVPVMAEIDANGTTGDRLALIIRPMVRLRGGARYIVALVGLRNAAGQPLAPIGFTALRDRQALSKSLMPLAARYEEIFSKLGSLGIERKSLTLAWDVVTSSEESMTSHLVGMRKTAFDMIGRGELTYKITGTPLDHPAPSVLRQIRATVQVPSYLADDSGTSNLNLGADGEPAMRAIVDVPVVINIPSCITDVDGNNAPRFPLPRPSVVFGHGLFGNAQDTLDSSGLQSRANAYCAIYLATDWIGLASEDVLNVSNLLGADLNNTWVITDRLQQAHLNAQVMTRIFLTQIVNDEAMKVTLPGGAGPVAVTDGAERYYFGVSNGGIQGGTFMALSDDITKGVLNVPGCDWSLLIFRSSDFGALRPLLNSALHDTLDAQVAIMLTQSEWDYTDPATFAPHLIHDPLPGAPAKSILVQESIGDAQVSNVATRLLARTIGLDGLDLEQPVYGVTAKAAPLDSAYTQWDSRPALMPPLTNTALSKDNGAHDAVWRSELAQTQIRAFLTKDGKVTSVCSGGVCDISTK